MKAASLTDMVDSVQQAFYQAFPTEPMPMMYVDDVLDDNTLIVCEGDKTWKVPYQTAADGTVTFSPRTDWTQVEETYVPIKSSFLGFAGDAVKTAPGGKVSGYLVRFSDEKDPDLQGEFFTKSTDFGPHTESPVLFHHGLDPKIGQKSIGKGTLKFDDIGVWIDGILDMRDEYEKAIFELAQKGKLGWSSGTAGHLISRMKKGNATQIVKWALGLDASLTPTPCEPRNVAFSMKSLPTLSIEPEAVPTSAAPTTQPITQLKGNTMETPNNGTPNVSDNVTKSVLEDIAKTIQDRKAAEQKKADEAAALKATVLGMFEQQLKDYPIDPSTQGGKSANIVKGPLGDDQNKAFRAWMKGDRGAYKADVALNTAVTDEGDVTVPPDFYANVVQKRDEVSIARAAGATVIQTSLTTLTVPTEGTREDLPVLTAQSQGATNTSYDMNAQKPFTTQTITVYKYTRMHKLSEELVNDNKANVESFLAARIGRTFGLLENDRFLLGDGSGDPQGAVVGSTKGADAAAAASIAAGDVLNLYYSLSQPYRDGAVWAMAGATEGAIRKLTGNFFSFAPTPQATAGAIGLNTLVGNNRVFNSASMASIAASHKSVLFGNWQYFMIAENQALTIRRLNERFADTGEIGFLVTARFGSVVTQAEAFMHLLHPSA